MKCSFLILCWEVFCNNDLTWNLGTMDITKLCVSSFKMLCQAFTAAFFSCCLFVDLSAFRFVLSMWNAAWSGWDLVTWLLQKNSWILQYVLGHCWSILWSTVQSTLILLVEFEKKTRTCTLQNSEYTPDALCVKPFKAFSIPSYHSGTGWS